MKKIIKIIFVATLTFLAAPLFASAAIGDMVTYQGTGTGPASIIFDGTYIWTVNGYNATRVTQTGSMTNFSLGAWFSSYGGNGIAFDGVNILASGRTVGPGVGYGGIVKLSTVTGGVTFYGYPDTVNIYPGGSAFDGANPTMPWIITNPNGNLWTTQWNWMTIHKTTPSGAFSFYTIPTTSPACTGGGFFGCIFVGPRAIAFDGVNMWTANSMASTVTKVNPSGGAVMYSTAGVTPSAIAFDGTNMWTANGASPLSLSFGGSNSVTKITPTGGVTTYTGTGSRPVAIAFDGTNMWTANMGDNSVTKITPSGAMTTFTGTGANPIGIAFDGANMWTANGAGNSVTKINAVPSGTLSTSSNLPSSWTITSPATTITGSGTSQTSTSQPAGVYTITWNPVAGYNTPAPQTLTLTSGGTINFNANYTPLALPNLTASSTSPTSATTGIPVSFSTTITNSGTGSTAVNFSNFFQVATAINGGGTIIDLPSTSMSILNSGARANSSSPSYTFTNTGTYSVRACADKSSSGNVGTITESNEGDNCGAWTNITVTNTPPVVTVGGDQTITLPTSSVTLSGNATDSNGSIASKTWTKISGPSGGAITSPNSLSTSVTGLVAGTYKFRLTATDNLGVSAYAELLVVVNVAVVIPTPVSVNVSSATIQAGDTVAVVWNIKDPDNTCSIKATTASTTETTRLNNIFSSVTGTTDANDPYGASRLLKNIIFPTAQLTGNVRGQKTVQLYIPTTFTARCTSNPSGTSPRSIMVNVTHSVEG